MCNLTKIAQILSWFWDPAVSTACQCLASLVAFIACADSSCLWQGSRLAAVLELGYSTVLQSSCKPGDTSVQEPAEVFPRPLQNHVLCIPVRVEKNSWLQGIQATSQEPLYMPAHLAYKIINKSAVDVFLNKLSTLVMLRYWVCKAVRVWKYIWCDMDLCPYNTCLMVASVSSRWDGSRIRPFRLCERKF